MKNLASIRMGYNFTKMDRPSYYCIKIRLLPHGTVNVSKHLDTAGYLYLTSVVSLKYCWYLAFIRNARVDVALDWLNYRYRYILCSGNYLSDIDILSSLFRRMSSKTMNELFYHTLFNDVIQKIITCYFD